MGETFGRRVATVVVALISTSCSTRVDGTVVVVDELIDPNVPRAVAGQQGWSYQQQATADLDRDGKAETVVLTSDISLDARGRPVWEDGHRWVVYIESEQGPRTYIYARFLPQGTLIAELGESRPDASPVIVLLERMPGSLNLYEIGWRRGAALLSRFERRIDPARTFSGSPRP